MKPERIQLNNSNVSLEWVSARMGFTVDTRSHEQAHAVATCLHQQARALGVEDLATPVDEKGRLTVSIPVESAGLTEEQQSFFETAGEIAEVLAGPFDA